MDIDFRESGTTGNRNDLQESPEKRHIINDILEEENELGVIDALNRNLTKIYGSDFYVEYEAERCIKPSLTIAEKFADNGFVEAVEYLALAERAIKSYENGAGLEEKLKETKGNVFLALARSSKNSHSYNDVLNEFESYKLNLEKEERRNRISFPETGSKFAEDEEERNGDSYWC